MISKVINSDKLFNATVSLSNGLNDSLSIQKSIMLVCSDSVILFNTFKIVAMNLALLLGSISMYEGGILPFLISNGGIFDKQQKESKYNVVIIENTAFTLYHFFWIIPIYFLCYGCSITWYQELSDIVFYKLNGTKVNKDVKKSISESIYATFVWLFTFIEVQLLTIFIPTVIITFSALINPRFTILITILKSFAYSFKMVGSTIMSILYGWYGFDSYWVSKGFTPDERYKKIESNWLYLFGFGLPYVVIIKTTSFFVGYGIFLALFPFCIIQGALSDKDFDKAIVNSPPNLNLFYLPKYITLNMLKSFKINKVNKNRNFKSIKKINNTIS
mmetsp:Transcript_13410/g.12144  ORF Transcript_13410/g.12144 Transcript_13410/m.12144 type:complete len:331 (-) Transcript_13410:7-999(-)